ncbi:MAG: DUF4037 domain-containing protein [Erysipelotrichaceae bacterium]|nr:DUF4037 domain-containing protein [Erysipelotrichaceae bacterium]
MKGLELSRKYYEQFGKEMIESQFSDIADKLAVGLFGSGSECYGYDDEISKDHDFEPGFCIFVPDEIDDRTMFQLERAYNKLPKEFLGYSKSLLSPVGGNRHGVFRIGDYFLERTGSRDGVLSLSQWFSLPEYVLLETVNGEVFSDNYGLLKQIRNNLSYYPEDIRLKKIAGCLIMMNQSGQYNYRRCINRNDNGAAQLAVNEFVIYTYKTVFLLNRQYCPYYKWIFHAMRNLDRLSYIADFLEYLLNSGNSPAEVKSKTEMIDNVVSLMTAELLQQGLIEKETDDLEKAAHMVNKKISDNDIRNLNILIGV